MKVDHSVAEAIGLDLELDLAQAAADFYVLEGLERDLYPVTDDTRSMLRLLPASFGSDTRRELRAYETRMALSTLETKLATQFSKYIVAATGGEARYFKEALENQAVWTWTGTKWVPVDHELILDSLPELVRNHVMAFDDVGPSLSSRTKGWSSWWLRVHIEGVRMSDAMRQLADVFDHPVFRPVTYRYVADGENQSKTGVFVDPDDFTKPLRTPFLWQEKNFPDDYTKEYVLGWSNSIGGPNWASPCRIVADYMDGVISRRTFIDRCWTLQHNGGSLFNKLWETAYLMIALARQAEDPTYAQLVEYCSERPFAMWVEQYWSVGAMKLPQRGRFKAALSFSDGCGHCGCYSEGGSCCDCGEMGEQESDCDTYGHEWSGGECYNCGADCDHEGGWYYGITHAECQSCSWTCEHGNGFDIDHECVICGMRCPHPTWGASICTDCGYECDHDYPDFSGVCGTCGFECQHPNGTLYGACMDCDKEIEEVSA